MAVSPPSGSYELSDYGGVLRRRWWIVLVVTCIGLLAAGGYVAFAHKTYTSTVLVQVNALPTNSSTAAGSNATNARTTGAVNMDNEAEVVQSASVAALANKQLHSPLSLPQLTKQIFVAVPPNTTFLQISCKASSAAGAANCANDFGNAYLAASLAKAVTATSHTQSTIAASISRLTSSIRALRLQMSYLPAKAPRRIADRVTLNVDNIALSGLESQLNQTTAELASLGTGSAGTVASPALPPTTPSSPRLLLMLPSGLVAGLVIGLLAAFYADRRDKRIHTSRDLERFFGVPVLLNSVSRGGIQKSIVSPTTPSGQAFAQLAQSVATSFGHGEHILLVAGTSPGMGSGIIAANLAATLARSRADVVLVCAGERETMAARLLGTSRGPGLSELLAGSATLGEAARQVKGIPRLRVISPGRGSTVALEDPHGAAAHLMAALSNEAHYIIVEVPSVAEDATRFTMAEFADGAVIAVEIDRTTRDETKDCIEGLQRVRVFILGAAVLPRFRPSRSRRADSRGAPDSAADGASGERGMPVKSSPAHSTTGDAPDTGNGTGRASAGETSPVPVAVAPSRHES